MGLNKTRMVTRAKLGAEQTRESMSVLSSLVVQSAPMLLAVAVVAASTRWLDSQAWLPWDAPTSPIATDLFAALAGFSGLFIGFYFTALGFVVQSVYTAGSRELRRTILRGRLEVSYVQYVVFLGVLSLVHLGMESLGAATGPISVGATALAGAVALVGAGGLMTSGLRFLDPAVLAAEATSEFIRVYARVDDREPTGSVSRDAQRRCQAVVNVFPELVAKIHPGADPSTAASALVLLRVYWATKGIRSWDSGWWPPEVQRPDWFRASSGEITVALKTGTQLGEKSAPDLLWVERVITRALCDTLRQMLMAGDSLEAAQLIASTGVAVNEGGQRLLVEESVLLADGITDTLIDFVRETDGDGRSERVGGARMLDVWDAHGSLLVQLLIGVRDGWGAFAPRLRSQAETVPRDTLDGAESLAVPLRSQERLADLVGRLRFESTVEGRADTPVWYWLDFMAPFLLRSLHRDLEVTEALVDRNQGEVRPLLGAGSAPLVAASAARRTLEVRQKWETCREAMDGADVAVRAFDRSKDFELLASPFDGAASRAARERTEDALWALDEMPRLVSGVGDPAAEELLGHTYTLLMHRCVEAVVSADLDTFTDLFSRTFWLGAMLDGTVPFQRAGMRELDQALLAAQPALDLMALSGVALIRDDASGSGFWEPVRHEWNRLLAAEGDGRQRVERLLSFADGAVGTYGVGPRYLVRTGWIQEMGRALRSEEITVDHRMVGSGPPPPRSLLHAASGGSLGLESPINVFAGYFLLTHPLAVGLTSDRGPGRFLRRYDRIRTGT